MRLTSKTFEISGMVVYRERQEVTGNWRKLDEEHHDLYASPSVTTIKSKKVSWLGEGGACSKHR